jgi:hypothetical protein
MKNMLLLLLALIVVPAWATEAAPVPAPSSSAQAAQPAPKHRAKTHKTKKTGMNVAAKATTSSCLRMTCGGVQGCFYKGCTGSCTTC